MQFVQEAKRNLPLRLPKGSIIKIPVNIETGKCVEAIEDDQGKIVFYAFIKHNFGWHFLGRGLTS